MNKTPKPGVCNDQLFLKQGINLEFLQLCPFSGFLRDSDFCGDHSREESLSLPHPSLSKAKKPGNFTAVVSPVYCIICYQTWGFAWRCFNWQMCPSLPLEQVIWNIAEVSCSNWDKFRQDQWGWFFAEQSIQKLIYLWGVNFLEFLSLSPLHNWTSLCLGNITLNLTSYK